VGDSQNENFLFAPLERDDVRKPLENRSPDQWHCAACARPFWKRIVSVNDSIKHSRYCGNELLTQTNAPLLIPKGGAAKLRTRFRM
jgi:hypothetical protein